MSFKSKTVVGPRRKNPLPVGNKALSCGSVTEKNNRLLNLIKKNKKRDSKIKKKTNDQYKSSVSVEEYSGEKLKNNLTAQNTPSSEALRTAIRNEEKSIDVEIIDGNTEAVIKYIQSGNSVNRRVRYGGSIGRGTSYTLLQLALIHNHAAIAKLLIQNGADIRQIKKTILQEILQMGQKRGQKEIVDILLTSGIESITG